MRRSQISTNRPFGNTCTGAERRSIGDDGRDERRTGTRLGTDEPPPRPGRFVTVRGLRLYFREQGDGHPLLLINGLGGHADMWGPAEERLAETSRTIVFDAPGTGRSSTSPVPIPLPAVARLLTRVLDELGHERVDVAGYSLGGVMAQQFARTAPQRVRRLALVATSSGWGSAPPDLASLALISTPARYLSPQLYKATSHLLDGGDRFRDPNLKHAQAERRNRHPPSLVGYAQQFLQGSTWSSLHWSYRLTMPTLVIGGARDRLVPAANSLLLAYRLPDSRLHLLPDEGHLMLFDPLSALVGPAGGLLLEPRPRALRRLAHRRGGRRLRAGGGGAARRARRAAAEGAQRRLSRVGARARRAEGVRELVAEDDEGLALFDRLALGAQDRLHRAGGFRLDRHLHLHRLEDHDRVALVDGVADRDLDLPHRAGDMRLDVRHGRGRYHVAQLPPNDRLTNRYARGMQRTIFEDEHDAFRDSVRGS